MNADRSTSAAVPCVVHVPPQSQDRALSPVPDTTSAMTSDHAARAAQASPHTDAVAANVRDGGDRTSALRDRGTGAHDRGAAGPDRTTSSADRSSGARERGGQGTAAPVRR